MKVYTGHPELQDGEVFIMFIGSPYVNQIYWETRRFGEEVLNKYGYPFRPVFVKLSEIETKITGKVEIGMYEEFASQEPQYPAHGLRRTEAEAAGWKFHKTLKFGKMNPPQIADLYWPEGSNAKDAWHRWLAIFPCGNWFFDDAIWRTRIDLFDDDINTKTLPILDLKKKDKWWLANEGSIKEILRRGNEKTNMLLAVYEVTQLFWRCGQ